MADRDYAINQDLTALVSTSSELDARYLNYAIGSVAEGVARDAVGTGVTGVTRDYINNAEIYLPPLETQLQIVHQIDEEKSQVDSARKLIETYEVKTQAVIAKLWSE
jgi:restriction endonuclease S subunit